MSDAPEADQQMNHFVTGMRWGLGIWIGMVTAITLVVAYVA